jgi:hypothetical protein
LDGRFSLLSFSPPRGIVASGPTPPAASQPADKATEKNQVKAHLVR